MIRRCGSSIIMCVMMPACRAFLRLRIEGKTVTFEEILDQAIAMLQRKGRVSYRALKLQFRLDDEVLDALKDEIIEVHQLAVDQGGKMLVWAGDTGPTPVPPSPQPAMQEDRPAQAAFQPSAPQSPDAERRQLTVMFCDLVDATPLSEQLDPEDLREVVRAYQQTCAEVIRRFDGHVAQLLGDALLVYFGWPQAHEDDAQRSIRAGLGILDAMGTLNARLEPDKGIRLAVRVGIHTGLVVVGEMGGGGHQEQLALGDTPNVASRLQGLAAPDTVVISQATYRLIEGYFICQALGTQMLKGVSHPMPVYRVLSETGMQSRLDVASTRGLTPLVGRASEVSRILEHWEQVKKGQGHVVLLSGEGGIGKSRLIQVLKAHVAGETHVRFECRSSSYYQNTALYPLIDLWEREAGLHRDDTPETKLAKLERALSQYRLSQEETVPLLAALLSLPLPEGRYPGLRWTPQQQRQKTLETMIAMVLERSEQQPVLFILEDLHWTDPSTLEWLDLLIDRTPTSAIYTLLAYRPAFRPPWDVRTHLTPLALTRLDHTQIDTMVQRITGGKRLPDDVLQQIIDKTDGVPLFVEEMTRTVLESGHVHEVDGHYVLRGTLPTFAIPSTLQDLLMARLDRLVTAKAVAQYAAVIGRQFSYEVLQAISQLDAPTLQRELQRLVEAEILYQQGLSSQAIYTFKHALIQDAAYQSLLKSTRQQVHHRIARVLEAQFPDTVEVHPELVAYHYTEAGLNKTAVGYWQQAGQKAIERRASQEAVSHLTKGLEGLKTVPDTPERTQQELAFQTSLSQALMITRGYATPEVLQAYTRAAELCRQTNDTPQLLRILRGLEMCHLTRAEFQSVREIAEQIMRLAQSLQEPVHLIVAHYVLGQLLTTLGAWPEAQAHLGQVMALYDQPQHHRLVSLYGFDPGPATCGYLALGLWCLGYPDQAIRKSHEGLALSRTLSDPYMLGFALQNAACIHLYRREAQTAQEMAEAAMNVATEHGFPFWLTLGMIYRGAALAMQGQVAEGIAQLRDGQAAFQAAGAAGERPHYLAMLAEAHGSAGQIEAGLTLLDEALALVHKTEERAWEPEVYRLKGELLLKADGGMRMAALTPEDSFQHALDLARRQQAKSWELRASTSLSRLWRQQGKGQQAQQLLAEIYGWFTEGFDTCDLKATKILLNELG